jgi:predicted histone-like DNA-binding protein
MPITITPIGKTNPSNPEVPMRFYPKVIKTGEVNLEAITEEIVAATSLTEADCYAVIISLVKVLEQHLEKGEIVRLEPLGTFQLSVKGSGSPTPEDVSRKNVSSASIIFRPGKRLRRMLENLVIKRKK